MSYAPEEPPQRGWFARNWLWFVPLMLLGLAAVVCVGCGAIFAIFGERIAGAALNLMPEYAQAQTIVKADPAVIEALGEPIEVDGMPTDFRQDFQGGSISRGMSFRIKGPKGVANVRVEADVVGDQATIRVLDVNLPDGKVLNLAPPATGGEAEPTTGDGEPPPAVPAETSEPPAESDAAVESEAEAPAPM